MSTEFNKFWSWRVLRYDSISCLQEINLRKKDIHSLKVKRWKKIFQDNGNENKSWVHNSYIRQNRYQNKGYKKKEKEGHYIILKESIKQEDITLVNAYAPTIRTPKYVKQILMDIKWVIDSNTVIVGDVNTTLTSMDRSSKQKINKETVALNDTPDQMDLINIFRAFLPNVEKYMFFSSTHGTFLKIDHMLRHKSSLNKF